MKTSRRDFIAKSGAAAAAMHDLAHAQAPNQGHDHEHEHSLVPSDRALRVKSLEGMSRSIAEVVSPASATVKPGEVFKLKQWVPSEKPLLPGTMARAGVRASQTV